MLINYRVSNFLSFNSETEFSMLKGKSSQLESHVVSFGSGISAIKLLKFGVLYGANASGKSNWVKSLDFAKSVIVDGLKNTHYLPSHFRLDETAKERTSRFEFEIIARDGKAYAYGFELKLDRKTIKEEWLFELKKTTDKPIFERVVKDNGLSEISSTLKLSPEDKTRFTVYSRDVEPDELLLSVLGSKSWELSSGFFQDVYQWFTQQLLVLYPSSKFHVFSLSDKDVPKFEEQLRKFNTGIVEVDFREEKAAELLEKMPEELRNQVIADLQKGKEPVLTLGETRLHFSTNSSGDVVVKGLLTEHRGKDGHPVLFTFESESDGTRRLFDLIPLLLLVSQTPVTVIIDEIDRSLHPELSRNLLETVAEQSRGIASQFIVTTHESSLLDLKLLRRDEIWFVEKSNYGESKLYSLEEFKPRFDKELRKAYLQGRFGAIPFIMNPKTLGWSHRKNTEYHAQG